MPFGSFQVSDEDAVGNAIRFVKEAGADPVKLEGAGPMVSRSRAIVESRDPRDGPHRADPAVRDDARWLQGAGRTAAEARALVDGRARARGGRLLLARARGRAGAGGRGDQRASSRSRRSGSARVRGATARCSSTTTCSGSRGAPAALREAVRQPLPRDHATRSRPTSRRCGAAPSPGGGHTYAMPEEELEAFDGTRLLGPRYEQGV